MLGSHMTYLQSNVFRYHDTFPHPPEVPVWPELIPDVTAEQIPYLQAAGTIVGDPDHALEQCKRWEAAGADQLSFGLGMATQGRVPGDGPPHGRARHPQDRHRPGAPHHPHARGGCGEAACLTLGLRSRRRLADVRFSLSVRVACQPSHGALGLSPVFVLPAFGRIRDAETLAIRGLFAETWTELNTPAPCRRSRPCRGSPQGRIARPATGHSQRSFPGGANQVRERAQIGEPVSFSSRGCSVSSEWEPCPCCARSGARCRRAPRSARRWRWTASRSRTRW